MSSSNSKLPTTGELEKAMSFLAKTLDGLGIKYGMIGGGAVAVLVSKYGRGARLTEDIDFIMQPNSKFDAYTLANKLMTIDGFVAKEITRGYSVPAIPITRGNEQILVDIEIFDELQWVQRSTYYNLNLPENATQSLDVNGQTVRILNPSWLLRQKILAHSNRNSTKQDSDLTDVRALYRVMLATGQRLDMNAKEEKDELKGFLQKHPEERQALKRVINCPGVL